MRHLIIVILLASAVFLGSNQASAAMQTITPREAGATSGETLKTGAQKINANFSEHEGEINALSAGKADKSQAVRYWADHAAGTTLAVGTLVAYEGKIYATTQAFLKTAGATPVGFSSYFEPIAGATYTLPAATADTLGGVKVGERLTMTDGVLSADVQSGTGAVDSVNGKIGAVVLTPDDMVDTSTTNKFVTGAEKTTWSAKQNALVAGTDYLAPTGSAAGLTGFPNLNQNTTGTAAGLTAQYINWESASGGSSIANKPTLGTASALNVGTSANNIVQLNSSGALPAVSGANLTNLPSASLPSWLPSTGPTADNQIIQATAAGSSGWTDVFDGLINDAGTGTDDLLSAAEITSRMTSKMAAPGPIGSATPNTGTFTVITAASFDTTAPATGETGEIGLQEDPANGTNTITLKAPASLASDVIFTLPAGVAPASAAATGTPGQWWYDANYWYVCIAINTWKRAPLATW